jgi:predicted component of type VI protein secretion system
MQVRLQVSQCKADVKEVRLSRDTLIGRSHDCNLKIGSHEVSRRHCRILVREQDVAVEDLGSANGTFVNDDRIPPHAAVALAPGALLVIGPARFVVQYEPPLHPAGGPEALHETLVPSGTVSTPVVASPFQSAEDGFPDLASQESLPEPDPLDETPVPRRKSLLGFFGKKQSQPESRSETAETAATLETNFALAAPTESTSELAAYAGPEAVSADPSAEDAAADWITATEDETPAAGTAPSDNALNDFLKQF